MRLTMLAAVLMSQERVEFGLVKRKAEFLDSRSVCAVFFMSRIRAEEEAAYSFSRSQISSASAM